MAKCKHDYKWSGKNYICKRCPKKITPQQMLNVLNMVESDFDKFLEYLKGCQASKKTAMVYKLPDEFYEEKK